MYVVYMQIIIFWNILFLGERLILTLKTIGKQISSSTTELRIRALNCVENLIRVSPNDQNNRVCSIVQKWFQYLHETPLLMIITYAQNPFLDIRCAGLNLLQTLSEQLWSQQLIHDSPGLVEFFLDRRVETAKESKEIKYEIVKCLSVSSIFEENILERLQQYVKEGPFYVRAVTEVAIEGES